MRALLKKYSHIVYAWWVPLYVLGFLGVQKIITPDMPYTVAFLPLDNAIPFLPWFVVFYYLWFPAMVFTGFYLLFTDAAGLKRYMTCVGWGFCVVLFFYFLIPSGQPLTPSAYPPDDGFALAVQELQEFDSNMNVFPSGHVMGAVVTLFAVFDSPRLRKWWILLPATVLTAMICLSTVFIKQHSLIDLIASGLLCFGLYFAVYSKNNVQTTNCKLQ
ncbi:MAG: phosphatase PAP2 family protein [Clostridiales bacterium]|nr:phosphatase PAP2 family protein [Clostridiales bacterium]